MKIKKTIIWSLLNHKHHPQQLKEISRDVVLSILNALFPGMTIGWISDLSSIESKYMLPALQKQFPDMKGMPNEKVQSTDVVNIEAILPTKEFQHYGARWKKKFAKLMAA